MRILITGATGLIGRRLVVDRLERGDQVVIVSRNAASAERVFAVSANRNISVVQGNPAIPGPWQKAIDGVDVVIHLAGVGLTERRWNAQFKQLIRASRVDSTHQVVRAIEQARQRPRLLINGSAIGYYPDAGSTEIDEQHAAGTGFLADVCKAWEEQAIRAQDLGARVVLLRTAVVLDDRGGALKQMAMPFKFFLGGPIGSGRQFVSWIHWRDLIGLIDLAIEDQSIRGALNASSPHPVQQREFASALGYVLGRPSWLRAPRIGLRIVLGEIAHSVVASQRVVPRKAIEHHHEFLYPEVEAALMSLLGPQDDRDNVHSYAIAEADEARVLPEAVASVDHGGPTRPTRSIRLVAIAVDGTLLNSDGSIGQAVVQSCRSAARAGVAIVLATARPPRACRAILQTLDLDFPTINYNGAAIWDPRRNEPQFEELIPPSLVGEIVEIARGCSPQFSFHIEVRDRLYVDRLDPRVFPADDRFLEPDEVGSLERHLRSPVARLSIVGAPEQIQAVLEIIRERYWRQRRVAVFLPDARLIQITHPMVDKAIALQRLIRRMSIVREEVMTIGGTANDMGMIEWAGFGLALDNAPASVKRLAKAVMPSNDNAGVAKALQRYILSDDRRLQRPR